MSKIGAVCTSLAVKPEKPVVFPCLRVSDEGIVFLFRDKLSNGVVVHNPTGDKTTWTSSSYHQYHHFTGTITLTQE